MSDAFFSTFVYGRGFSCVAFPAFTLCLSSSRSRGWGKERGVRLVVLWIRFQ